MDTVISPNPRLGHTLGKSIKADANMCWTCGSCMTECPVNICTSRLQPLKVIRMANLGLLEELLRLPELWYCLSCNLCSTVCPNKVKPADLITYLKFEAIRYNIVSTDILMHHKKLIHRLNQARWHLASHCQNGRHFPDDDIRQYDWFEKTVKANKDIIQVKKGIPLIDDYDEISKGVNSNSCLTCRECSSACPVFSGNHIFDPVSIFRMINLGMIEELLASPSIWLCVACGRCTRACSQLVKGLKIIQQLQDLALKKGNVDHRFKIRFQEKSRSIFSSYLDQVDSLMPNLR